MAAWFIYAVLSFLLFPQLKITVMLFSIPLSMLGGWLYTFKGAIATPLLNIPFHFFILQYYSNDLDVILQAFNPLGICTALCFSLSTALLKATQQRYERLSSTLQEMVEERTQSLSRLADHLIQSKDMEIALAETAVIDEPARQLKQMLETSKCLEHRLKDAKHPGCETAGTITRLIGISLEQLNILEMDPRQSSKVPKKTCTSIQQLADEFVRLSGNAVELVVAGSWEKLDRDTFQRLCPIVHEACHNALRHADPSRITIELQINPSETTVSVENNGKSMPTSIGEGMGIPLMRYHAQRMGAALSFEAGREPCTRVQCVIPNGIQ
jgi:glucose-6-phosphate-specific signal transduction histidine kinase